jgi:hypothetical protein
MRTPLLFSGAARATWEVGSMTGLPLASVAEKSGVSNSSLPVSGAPSLLEPPEDPLLVGHVVGVPDLDVHADLAGHLVGAPAVHPVDVVVHPDELVEVRGLLDIAGAVLEAHQVARRRLARAGRSPAEAEDDPAGVDDPPAHPGQVADRVVGDLRVVRARLDRQVAAGQLGTELVAGQGGEVGQQLRPAVGQPEALVEDARAEPHGHGEGGRSEVEGLAGVPGHRTGPVGRDRAHRLPGHALGDGRRPARQQDLQLLGGRRGDVEGHEDAVALLGGVDAGLVRAGVELDAPAEVHRVEPPGRCRGRAAVVGQPADPEARAEAGRGDARAGPNAEAPAGEAVLG